MGDLLIADALRNVRKRMQLKCAGQKEEKKERKKSRSSPRD
jgi:hypothetical protein